MSFFLSHRPPKSRSFLSKYLLPKYKYRVEKVSVILGSIVEIYLSPLNTPISFAAGQYIFFSVKSDLVAPESHPFGFSSAADQKDIRISIKPCGDYTNTVHKIRKGDIATLEGPYGTFGFEQTTHTRQVWIAGGIGVVPFLSMVHELKNRSELQVDLHYGIHSNFEPEYIPELESIAKITSNLQFHAHFDNKSDFITAKKVIAHKMNVRETDFMLCGPPKMISSLRERLEAAGVPEQNICYEHFNL